jgi:hypothetical protein
MGRYKKSNPFNAVSEKYDVRIISNDRSSGSSVL